MQPAMHNSHAALATLRMRASVATAALYAMIGKEQPVQKIRYQVQTKGNAYHIVDLSTGLTKGFRWTWKEAINFAQQLEARADGIKLTLSGERK